MKSGIHIEQGEIWLVPYPYTDLSRFKKRPVLIISKSNFNSKQDNLLVCQISSVLRKRNYTLQIDTDSIKDGKLKTTSEVRFYNLTILHKDIFLHKIGQLNNNNLKLSLKTLKTFLDNSIF